MTAPSKTPELPTCHAGQSLAPAPGSAAVERERRNWWAVADGDVREVTGYSCAPSNPAIWWCPKVGFSGAEGHHLFETRDKAFAKAIAESERDLAALKKRLEGLKRRRQNDKVSDGSQPPMALDLLLGESAGSRSLHRLVRHWHP